MIPFKPPRFRVHRIARGESLFPLEFYSSSSGTFFRLIAVVKTRKEKIVKEGEKSRYAKRCR